MLFRRRSETQGLTGGAYVLTDSRGYTRRVLLVLALGAALALAAGGVRFYLEYFESGSRVSELEQQNRELRVALDKARVELEVELATRNELERQLGQLNERLRQAEEELAFFRAATTRPGGR